MKTGSKVYIEDTSNVGYGIVADVPCLDENTGISTSTGTKYDVRIVADGSNLKVYRSTGGGLETQVFNTSSVPTYSGTKFLFYVSPNLVTTIGKVMVLADDMSRTTTFTPASNNELSSASDYNGSTTYAYDASGRMSTETKNSVTKTYTWTGPSLLAGVSSSASGATNVSYTYTGDNKRLFRLENGNIKNSYTYGAGFDVNAETAWSGGSPTTTKTYAGGGLAEVDVTGTPAYRYLTRDHLGSTTGAWDGSIGQTGAWEYTPYGAPYLFAASINVNRLYTGHDLDSVTGNYGAPYRPFNPAFGRWLSPDPKGMVDGTNVFGYVGSNPVRSKDDLGMQMGHFGDGFNIDRLLDRQDAGGGTVRMGNVGAAVDSGQNTALDTLGYVACWFALMAIPITAAETSYLRWENGSTFRNWKILLSPLFGNVEMEALNAAASVASAATPIIFVGSAVVMSAGVGFICAHTQREAIEKMLETHEPPE